MNRASRALVEATYPAMAWYYRSAKGCNSSPAFLKMLGIADASYRPSFYTLCRATEFVANNAPLIAECGVYKGSTLLGMAHILRRLGRPDWSLVGFDSFEGFPEPAAQDALPDGTFHPRALKGVFSDASCEGLSARVSALGFRDRISIVRGYFEQTLHNWSDRKFAIAHIDCYLYQSYRTCLDFFYERMIRGGFMIFDEYVVSAQIYPGAQKAVDEFFSRKPEKIERFEEAENPRYFIVKA